MPTVPEGTFSGPIYSLDAWQWQEWKHSEYDRAIVLVRDPRDRVVSEIYSHLYSHESIPSVDVDREIFSQIPDMCDRVKYGISKAAAFTQFYLSWFEYQDSSVLLVRYEDLVDDQHAGYARILEWLGSDMPRETRNTLIARLSFRERSGRQPGETDVFSHYRRGIAGDWKNHFDRKQGERWELVFPGLLEATGYETSENWWQDLPEARQGGTSSQSDQVPDEVVRFTETERDT